MEFNTILSIIIIVIIVAIVIAFSVSIATYKGEIDDNATKNTSQDKSIVENKKLIQENKEAIAAIKALGEEKHKVEYMFDTKAVATFFVMTAKEGTRTFDSSKPYEVPVTIYGYFDKESGKAIISTKQFFFDISSVKKDNNVKTLSLYKITTKYGTFGCDYNAVNAKALETKDDTIVAGTFKIAIPKYDEKDFIGTNTTSYAFSNVREGIAIPVQKSTKSVDGKIEFVKCYDMFVRNFAVSEKEDGSHSVSHSVVSLGASNGAKVVSIALVDIAMKEEKEEPKPITEPATKTTTSE